LRVTGYRLRVASRSGVEIPFLSGEAGCLILVTGCALRVEIGYLVLGTFRYINCRKIILLSPIPYPMKTSRNGPLPNLPAFPCGLCSLWGDSEGGQKDVYARLSPDL